MTMTLTILIFPDILVVKSVVALLNTGRWETTVLFPIFNFHTAYCTTLNRKRQRLKLTITPANTKVLKTTSSHVGRIKNISPIDNYFLYQ